MSPNDVLPANSTFAEPIGGVPVRGDFAPSLLFCLGFFAVSCIGIRNLFNPADRTLCKAASLSVSIERLLIMSMRMAACWRTDVRESIGMTEYQQISLGMGFMSILDELLNLIESSLVLATRDGVPWNEWWEIAQKDPSVKAHRGLERDKYRKWTARCHWAFLVAQSVQITSASFHWTGNMTVAKWVVILRFVGNCLSCLLIASVLARIYRFKHVEAIQKQGLSRPKITLICLLFIPIYRACVSFRKASTLATSPTSAIPAKVCFYVFQLLPELAACAIIHLTNYKQISDTGPFGDYPRRRIEMGLPPKPHWLAVIGYMFAPWTWFGAFTRLFIRWSESRATRQPTKGGLFTDQGREKLPDEMPTLGWKSVTDLSITTRGRSFYWEKTDEMAEKKSIKAETVYTRSGGWSTFGGSNSTSESRRTAQDINTSNSLITDVKLWSPRVPPAFRRE